MAQRTEIDLTLDTIIVVGKVFSGEGSGKKYLSLPWVRQQIKKKLGYSPYLGTLNLELSNENAIKRKFLEETQSDSICPTEGYCVGLLYKAQISCTNCAIVIPQVKNYPENILEIIASSNLRKKLKLRDGNVVSVSVFL
jgi:riboflavin kinase, archaea type